MITDAHDSSGQTITREILSGIMSNKSTRKPKVDDSWRCMDMMEYCKGY